MGFTSDGRIPEYADLASLRPEPFEVRETSAGAVVVDARGDLVATLHGHDAYTVGRSIVGIWGARMEASEHPDLQEQVEDLEHRVDELDGIEDERDAFERELEEAKTDLENAHRAIEQARDELVSGASKSDLFTRLNSALPFRRSFAGTERDLKLKGLADGGGP